MKHPLQILVEQLALDEEYSYLSKFSNEEIQRQWNAWDGMELFVFSGRVIDEHVVWGEMSRRGLETGI